MCTPASAGEEPPLPTSVRFDAISIVVSMCSSSITDMGEMYGVLGPSSKENALVAVPQIIGVDARHGICPEVA